MKFFSPVLPLMIALFANSRNVDAFVVSTQIGSTAAPVFQETSFRHALDIEGSSGARLTYCTPMYSSKLCDEPKTSEDGASFSSLLDRALNADSDAASTLLDEVSTLRESNSEEEVSEFLDSILYIVDNLKKPAWTKFRRTAKFSNRSRRASLHRLLNMSTPSAADGATDTEDAKRSRRRRALVVALRSLVVDNDRSERRQGTPIYVIEKMALRDIKKKATAETMNDRLPPDLETPKYDVLLKNLNFEIRTYEMFAVCSVKMNKARPDSSKTDRNVSQPQLPGASSFGALAGYLFGKNKEQKSMKMTTPVLTSGEGDNKEMAFVLPSSYWSEDSLPEAPLPLDNSLVELKRDIGGQRAVVMFGGFANSKEVEVRKKELIANVENEKNWSLISGATITIAQYNDPFTPPWKRRNEVSIPVEATSKIN